MNTYVAGIMFDLVTKEVALIRKNKPVWQAGKLNAIGGKIEAGETPHAAMVREFREETDCATVEEQWLPCSKLEGNDWSVQFFVTIGSLHELRSPESEKVEIHPFEDAIKRTDLVDGLFPILGEALALLVGAMLKVSQLEESI